MLTILHLAPELREGGPPALAADLAEELQRGGATHNLVIAPGGRRGSGVPYTDMPGACSPLLGGAVLHSYLRQSAVDIVVAYTEQAARAAGRARRKLPPAQRPRIVGALTSYPRRRLTGCGWNDCDAFCALSRHLLGAWEQFPPLSGGKPMRVIPYGTQESWCHPGYRPPRAWKDEWNARFSPAPNELTLCLPAPLTPLHGHEMLVPLLTLLRRNNLNPRVFLAGDTAKAAPRYPEHLKEIFRQAHLDRQIVWLGACPDLRDVLCACDITLSLDKQPSSYNRPVQEALCLGRPVAGYDHGVVGELLSAFLPEGRVAPGQVEAMADTIAQWSFYRPAAIESIPSPYRMSDTAESYLELFNSLRA